MVNRFTQEDVLMLDDRPTQETAVFKIYIKALHYLKAPVIYHCDLLVKHLFHISVAGFTIHFFREGLPGTQSLQADYNAQQEVSSGHSCFTNVSSNVLILSPDEIVQDDEQSKSGKKPIVNLCFHKWMRP